MESDKKKVIRLVLIVILIIIMLLLWLGLMNSKGSLRYKKRINSSEMAEASKPVFVVDGNSNIKIDGIEDTVYKFSVKNYDKTGKSNIDLRYSIQIVNNSQVDLDFILTNEEGLVNLNNNKTGLILLSSSKKQSDEYQLKIKYKNNPAITSDIDGNIQIKVETTEER